MKTLAIVPARGGSKGVLNKNRKILSGKPLIQYTLEAAIESKRLSSIIVSSDEDAILEIASAYQLRCHKRRPDLASDTSPVIDTILDILQTEGDELDAVMILQPTSPLRTSKNIDETIELLEGNPIVNSVISVVPMNDIHPARMYKLNNNELHSFLPEFEQVRRQDIPVAYYRNGAIYLTRTDALLANKSMMNKPIKPYVMDPDWLLNIDGQRDIFLAEALIPHWLISDKK
ncbi:MAG: acylneuraminate cytidylyltransferase family protein [Cyclobacteriaceae bacterium]